MWKFMGLSVMLKGLKNVTHLAPRMNLHTHYIEQSSDTVKTSFLVEMTNQDIVKGTQFRLVVRKFVENDSVVFICKSLAEQLFHESRELTDYFTRTTLRIVFRSDSIGETSLVDSYFTATNVNRDLHASRSPENLSGVASMWDVVISNVIVQVESLASTSHAHNQAQYCTRSDKQVLSNIFPTHF
ncbi:hypothetical protein P3T76_010492 [Phytophthora citrophthora]|uniref:Uncharacterized protein n=1 Tax=Phytophthora citrophthora TaxID=4793 RepID=A0AAD9LGD2_9STRA|nr:hypothetical protein P3T76_010492 [Phytophthora citrophthora]